VDATIDGRLVVHWTGSRDRLSLDPDIRAEVGDGLGLVSASQFLVSRLELLPLSSASQSLAPLSAARAANSYDLSAGTGHPSGGDAPAAHRGVVPSDETMRNVALVEHPLGSGSGFAVGKRLVVTNAHVVEGVFADEIKVKLGAEDGKTEQVARILFFDRARDISILELPTEKAGLAIRGDYKFTPGDRVTLAGNPSTGGDMLLRNAVNHGVIRALVHINEEDFYQIDASVNPGWSGGPIFDDDGRVVAVVAMKAKDEVVAQIRGSMGRLDRGFRGRYGRTSYGVGITYGIPAATVWDILHDPDVQSEQRQAAANDHCTARTLVDRLSFMAELGILRMQTHVPLSVRVEAHNLLRGLTASGKTATPAQRLQAQQDILGFLPDIEVMRLQEVLDSSAVKALESKFGDRLEDRVNAVQESQSLSDNVKRETRELAAAIHEADRFIEHPPAVYKQYSVKVKSLTSDLKEHLKHLAESLKEKEG
jgi:S1-C subfamily serine protease